MPKTNDKRREPQEPQKKQRRNISRPVPGYSEVSFAELIQEDRLFDSSAAAIDWFTQNDYANAKIVFGEGNMERITKISNSFRSENEDRNLDALKELERNIIAQVAWIEFFPLFKPLGKFDELVLLTRAIRAGEEITVEFVNDDGEVVSEQRDPRLELQDEARYLAPQAEEKARYTIEVIEAVLEGKPGQRDGELLKDIEDQNLLYDNRGPARGVRDPEWLKKLFEAYLNGEVLNLAQLDILLYQLRRVTSNHFTSPKVR